MPEKQTTLSKRGKDLDISPKKTYISLTNIWKDAQHHSLLEKCISKPQWDITSHQSEWPSSKSLQIINAGEAVENRGHSCTVVGMQTDTVSMKDSVEIPLNTGNKTTIWPSNTTPRHICWGNQNWKSTCIPLFIAALFVIARTWTQPGC